ncbi:MAG: protein kinase [Candidatus Binatia bacterium]
MAVPERIGRYRVNRELGRGGMGVVYAAYDDQLERPVAIKVIAEAAADEKARKRLWREARAAARLRHPNVCQIYEIAEDNDELFIAMELLEGESLAQRLGRGPLPVSEAVEISLEILSALDMLHRERLVHRDLKPSNIFLTPHGVKILDFGLAGPAPSDVVHSQEATESRLTQAGAIVGTPPYMAPEQFKGEPVDPRTDLFAMGAVIFEMLMGKCAFAGDTPMEVYHKMLYEPPPALGGSPATTALDRVLRRALAKRPEDRYATASEMAAALRAQYLEQVGAEESAVFTLRALLRFLRKPRIAIPVALTMAMVTVAATWFLDRQAKIRWAKEEALPEIERLVETSWRDFTEAYRLAEEAEQYIPNDPKLSELLSKCSLKVSIKTESADARIYMKEYSAPDSEWKYLGVSPIEDIRLPIGIFRWKMEKEGYETVLAASSTWDIGMGEELLVPNDLVRVLDEKGSIPPGMVRVPGAETSLGKLDDFYIDKYEVTNKQYKEFINSGGYRNREYWKQEFVKDGRVLTWQEAMAEFVDQTGRPGPATWQAGDYPKGQDDYPVSGVSWYEAAAYAEFAGKSLPTGDHWGIARGEYTSLILWPQLGGYAIFAPFSNFKGQGSAPVGSHQGMTSYGAYDLAGNVREWCWNETQQGRLIRGGAWNDNPYMFAYWSQASAFDRSSRNGFRCAVYPDPEKIPEPVFTVAEIGETRDFYKEKPVADSIFEIYKEQFSYDKTDLDARVESRDESSEDWIQEKITFDAAYGDERIIAHLFLPKNTAPPYQTVLYFPGSASLFQKSSEALDRYYEWEVFLSFVVKNGRAVLFPVYKGTFERRDDALIPIHLGDNSHLFTEWLIQLVKDFKRCIDYLETRQDIDIRKLAYYGMSWGGLWGAIIPAVEERLEASVLLAGGLSGHGRPEANQMNYVTRVKTPTLMLNGKYDSFLPYEASVKPMFDLLGTPEEHKELKLYETDHIPPMNDFIKETLAWLDRYLGPVNR